LQRIFSKNPPQHSLSPPGRGVKEDRQTGHFLRSLVKTQQSPQKKIISNGCEKRKDYALLVCPKSGHFSVYLWSQGLKG
jgi:hypothetical protein